MYPARVDDKGRLKLPVGFQEYFAGLAEKHEPVVLEEARERLASRPDGIYVDGTAGRGGHAGAIATQLTAGLVIANGRDPESLELAKANTADVPDRIRWHQGKYST